MYVEGYAVIKYSEAGTSALTPEEELWQEVLVTNVMDAVKYSPEDDCRRNEAARDRREAYSWIAGNSQGFREVATLAGFDPDFVRDAFRAGRIDLDALKGKGCEKRAKKGKRKTTEWQPIDTAQKEKRHLDLAG